ncbi:MAG: discoidin domain-containing protein [Pirellulales bacterium]|nr:discoidin domain-containing protein [Pirellulales bacterium]
MPPNGHRERPARRTIASAILASTVSLLLGLSAAEAADTVRAKIEADWRRQDECRMDQIRRPGTVRCVETEFSWPGVMPDDRLRVPRTEGPNLDGRLDDSCWSDSAEIPAESAQGPSFSLCHDGRRFYVGVSLPTASERKFLGDPTSFDAGGAVDGIKDGKYAFHTDREPNPWWEVDLGASRPLARIVVYNRLDYAPGLHNADNLLVLTSDDRHHWTLRHDNRGKHFGGLDDGKPLTVDFAPKPGQEGEATVIARYVRLQVSSESPVWFHLDEVEVFGASDAQKNIALGRPARQSSLSQWSRGGLHAGALFGLGDLKFGLHDGQSSGNASGASGQLRGITLNGVGLPADRAAIGREDGRTRIEIALPLEELSQGFPAALQRGKEPAVPLAAGSNWQIVWPASPQLGFGKNRLTLRLRTSGPLASPVELTVESVVFTPRRPERCIVYRQELSQAADVPIEFQTAHEGAAAILISARQGTTHYRDGRAYDIEPVQETLRRTERLTAEFRLEPNAALAALDGRIRAFVARETTEGPDPKTRRQLYREARWLAREVAFRNPALRFDELLLVKRLTQETYPDVCLNHMPWVSRPGGDICVVSLGRHDGQPTVRNLIDGKLGPGHVHGMDLWWDAGRAVFGYAQAKSDQPPDGWLDRTTSFELRRNEEPIHLFEIGIDGTGLRQLTDGQWSDLDPTYLANGDVAFVSERCGCSLQCNEYDKDETSCNLYVMRGDGSHIRRLSVSKDGDYLPHALDDGTIGYTRWEYQERGWAHIQSIWTVRPDGTGADALFKQHFNNPWALEDVRSIPGSKKLLAIATGHHTLPAGPVVVIDPRAGLNNPAGISIVTPGVLPPEGGMSGTPVAEGGVVGSGGFYMTPWALSENHFLASYTFGPQTDPTGYAIYLIDAYGTKELVYRDPEISCFIPIPLRKRPRPPVLPDTTDPTKDYAVCSIQEAGYGVEGVAPERIRYVRISKRDPWPYDNHRGGQRYEPDVKSVMVNWTPARVLGTVPVEADGSVCFQVPVDTPVYFQLLDENHMELRRMRSFISFQPGESRGCVGCHETRAEAAAAKRFPPAMVAEPKIPRPPPWGNRAISFLRDVQPVFDRHCVQCHSGLKPAGGFDFSGGLTERHNRAYDTILAGSLVSRSNVGDDARVTPPLAFGSHRSKLVEVLREGACSKRAPLNDDEWRRLVTWIDANAPYHDAFLNKRPDQAPYDLPADGQLVEKLTAVHARRCGLCHQPAEVTRADWIDIRQPSRSLFLAAPLAEEASGTGRCGQDVYRSQEDPDYQAVLAWITAAAEKARARPRRDLRAVVQK